MLSTKYCVLSLPTLFNKSGASLLALHISVDIMMEKQVLGLYVSFTYV